MIPLDTLGRAKTADGCDLVLYHRDGVYQIRIDGLELMSSNAHGSEKALAELAHDLIRDVQQPRVLVGGLGMGFTLRAALDCFPKGATIVVAELFAEVVEWNRGPLSHLAGHPLADPRVHLRQADVNDVLGEEPFDCILLDVDNGPGAFTVKSNARLYGPSGTNRLVRALKKHGVLALWSSTVEQTFERQLRRAGLDVQCHRVHARGSGGGARHAIYLVRRSLRGDGGGTPTRKPVKAVRKLGKKGRRRR
jgi:spermidine synthase